MLWLVVTVLVFKVTLAVVEGNLCPCMLLFFRKPDHSSMSESEAQRPEMRGGGRHGGGLRA